MPRRPRQAQHLRSANPGPSRQDSSRQGPSRQGPTNEGPANEGPSGQNSNELQTGLAALAIDTQVCDCDINIIGV